MPTYDYECSACGHNFELFQSITANPVKKCPACHKPRAKRLIGTGAGIIFKGSGFYQTDYRSEEYKKAAKAEKDLASGKDKKDKSPNKKDASPPASKAPSDTGNKKSKS